MIRERQAALDALYGRLFTPVITPASPSTNGHHTPTDLTDSDIVRLGSSEESGKFARLFSDGDTSEHGGDDSAADEALCCKIVFYTRDPGQIERIMSASALGRREKWTRRPNYRQRTIARALALVTESYEPAGSGPRVSRWAGQRRIRTLHPSAATMRPATVVLPPVEVLHGR